MSEALTHNETMVRTIRAAIAESVAGARSATQSSAGTSNSYTRHSLEELRQLEAHYLRLVASERRGGLPKVVVADFSDDTATEVEE
jgi:hypothetical protein